MGDVQKIADRHADCDRNIFFGCVPAAKAEKFEFKVYVAVAIFWSHNAYVGSFSTDSELAGGIGWSIFTD